MIKKILILEIAVFTLIILGVIPREFALVMAAGLISASLLLTLEEAVLLYIASIPFFLALPLTPTFDNFNTWRLVSLAIFLRWLLQPEIRNAMPQLFSWRWYRSHPNVLGLGVLLLLGCLSLIGSPDYTLGIKRIIYFANLSLIGIVIFSLARKNQQFIAHCLHAIVLPTIAVVVVGYIQIISTYLIDIYQFMALWGEGIQLRQFGQMWSYIAVELGNTWFAYYGDQLSLRVFSLFPDSHSFPQFVLLGIPALLALSVDKVVATFKPLMQMIRMRARMFVLWVPVALLITILSGTRGIWAASAGVLIIAMAVAWWLGRYADKHRLIIFRYLSLYLILFFFLFSIAYPIFVSPQFLLSKGDFSLLGARIKSILDFGETSNAQRILIWRKSIDSIADHPLLGVGVGNFPVVLEQDLFLARAGSSAHNIYLHIAAEMGIPALVVAVWLLWELFAKTYRAYVSARTTTLTVYFGAALLYVPWVLIYSLTDVALFDERSFLLFVTTIALIASHES